ncbi:hypothetical protein [Ferrimonas sp. YFM]|nr:hypothetical protein [Ferrimonas sp. YFM]BDY04754.1 hypothetical protein F0521_17950 [Ferrimonas sp. YFM]
MATPSPRKNATPRREQPARPAEQWGTTAMFVLTLVVILLSFWQQASRL